MIFFKQSDSFVVRTARKNRSFQRAFKFTRAFVSETFLTKSKKIIVLHIK